jgi:uncharacterized protein YkwD
MIKYLCFSIVILVIVSCEITNVNKNETPTKPVYQELFLNLLNDLRKKGATCGNKSMPAAGLLVRNSALESASLLHAKDMREQKYFSHLSKLGKSPADRAAEQNYNFRYIGENIYQGFSLNGDYKEAFEAWLNSPPHCENMMNPRFKDIGLGYDMQYWVLMFGANP